ncbi:uncharacterized protein LOC131634028 [Vicia villosa]|uniref:uncharacterized protein LOC131634028 n=1 Tax=Vicia villosa TaxID=3911 RepID=UPI00273B93C5|nr:uncharacterized protein LOC131634028 [Vicia villosa]
MLRRARLGYEERGIRSPWMEENVFKEMLVYLKSDQFKTKFEKAKQRRALERGAANHRAGSISIADRMAVAKRRTPLIQEFHERIYMGRDGEYCDDSVRDTQAEYPRMVKKTKITWTSQIPSKYYFEFKYFGFIMNFFVEADSQTIETAKFEASKAREEAALANARADKAIVETTDYVNLLIHSAQNDNNVDGSEKLQLWKEVVGVIVSNPNREANSQTIETAKAEASKTHEEAALANARVDKAIVETVFIYLYQFS